MSRPLSSQEIALLEAQWDVPARVRCTATSKTSGKRCKNVITTPGIYVCRFHGKANTLVDRAVKARLLPLAIATIYDVMQTGNGEQRLAAAKMALRYAGIRPNNVTKQSRSERTLKALGAGPTQVNDDEIESMLKALTAGDDGESGSMESGEIQAQE